MPSWVPLRAGVDQENLAAYPRADSHRTWRVAELISQEQASLRNWGGRRQITRGCRLAGPAQTVARPNEQALLDLPPR